MSQPTRSSSPFAGLTPTTIPTVTALLPVRRRLTVPQVLSAAAECVEARGHSKDWFEDVTVPAGEGGVCAVGAIRTVVTGAAVEDHPVARAAVRALSAWLPSEPPMDAETGDPDFVEHVADWNDVPSRTAAEVVASLRAAALAVAA
ncbi:hypothetical protein TR51_06390 [Kitasatospora griseola]|uniref:Uncharacterized protein n=1 Tax=Kitasatospora griseola TaxID=2064 RepID=A0A0D0P5X1_KITGR|nr:hypothetical protein [Kitasatospora griseola]KIQ67016.1 hypothetical protein TR51_06390 [Kitasatospora griseola]